MADPVTAGLPVAKCLVDPCFASCLDAVRRRCSYVTSYDDYVGELEHQAILLEQRRKTIQDSMDDAENHGKPIKTDFKDWADNAKVDAYEACRVLDDNVTATRFHGWLLNPKKRYGLGKDGKTIADRIKKRIELIPLGEVYDDPPPALVDGGPPMISSARDTIGQSRDSILREIMSALGDEKNKVIGIHGPGGVGKSTLLETVEKILRIEKRPFDMIAKAIVSQAPDLKQIQVDIARCFKLNLMDEPYEDRRRDLLLNTLKNLSKKDPNEKDTSKRVLVILDDLWKELDLEAVGIPSGDESSGCQVLLTSKDEQVLRKMGAPLRFPLKGLSPEESFSLFEKTYGPDKLKNNEGLKAKAAEMVAKLAGLPLLINSVARTLKSDESDESKLETALTIIKDSDIKPIVEWSYGHLEKEETKSLFLLCGFIGGSIRVELLLGLGMGLGLFEGFDKEIRSSRNKLNDMLRRLRSISLLEDGGADKESVTIHDHYSEQVISTPLTGQNSLRTHRNAGAWPKEKLGKCWVCLVNVGSDRLAELRLHWFPDSEIFCMLSKQHNNRDCNGLDFTSMKELRVLYLRSINFTSFRSSVEILENLQSLYLVNCDVEDVAILGEFKQLQILSFAGSRISSLPKEIGKLTKLKLLNLTNCYTLRKIEPGVFKGLTNLEELYMKRSFNGWMAENEALEESHMKAGSYGWMYEDEDLEEELYLGRLGGQLDDKRMSSESCKLAELKSLTKLTSLEISIRDPTVLLKDGDLPFGNLTSFFIEVGDLRKSEYEGLRTMKLGLHGCDGILSKEWVQKTLQKTQYLHLTEMKEFKKSVHELCSGGFPELKHLEIVNCYSVKHISGPSDGAFPNLESLFLERLVNLEKICDGLTAPKWFSKLKAIRVSKCHQLAYVWCLSQMHRLAQLEDIVVENCGSMRAIVIDDAGEDIVVANNGVELPLIRHLELSDLPKMTSFCIGAGITSEAAPIQESQSTSSTLQSDLIQKLPNFGSLKIQESSAEVLFNLEKLNVTGHDKILSRLTILKLSSLWKLHRMWKLDVQLHGISTFQNLQKIEVSCTHLTFLFPISVAKCLRGIIEIKVWFCDTEALFVDEDGRDEGTNDIIEFLLLKRLDINYCPELKSFSHFHGKKESVPTNSDSQDAYSDSFFDRKISLPSLEELSLSSGGSFKRIWPRELPKSSFDNLADLRLDRCSEVLNVFPSTVMGRLHKLRKVSVSDCPSLESVFECGPPDSNTEQTGVLLANLESISVSDCPSLKSVFDSGSQTVLGLPSLTYVRIERCSELRYLFPYPTAATLEKLRNLYVSDCRRMKEVVLKEEGSRSNAEVLSFPSLKDLFIMHCHPFGAFIRNPTIVERQRDKTAIENDESPQPFFNEMISFPNISKLEITGSRCKELWNNQVPIGSFCNLEELKLTGCRNLERIAPSHIWKKWQRCLKILLVDYCRSIEIIYESDGTHTEIVNLTRLYVRNLDNLRHIWQYDGLSNIPFPNLRLIDASNCPSLRILFPTFTAEFLGQIENIWVNHCENMELIADHGECDEATNTTIAFSKLTELRLYTLPKLRRYLPEKYSVEFPPEVRKNVEVPACVVPT